MNQCSNLFCFSRILWPASSGWQAHRLASPNRQPVGPNCAARQPMVLGTQGAGIRAHLSRYHRRTSCAHAEQSDQWYFGLCLSEPRYPIPPGHLYPANNPRSWHTLDVRLDNLGIELFAGYNTSLSNGVISGDSFGPVTLTFTPAAVPEPSTASLVAGRTWKAESVPILLTCPLFIASVRREAPSGRQGSVPVPLESAGLTPFC
jgi:hypothetical protein